MSNNPRMKQMSIHRPIVYGNTASLMDPPTGGHTHRWTIAVRSASGPPPNHYTKRGGGDVQQIGGADPLPWIKKVTFRLHETYANPVRTIDKAPFEVTETGWGEFDVQIKIFFAQEANEKPITFYHRLKLHPWPAEPPKPVAGASETSATPNASNPIADLKTGDEKAAATADTSASTPAEGTLTTNNKENQVATENVQQHNELAIEAPAQPVIISPVHSWQYDEVVFHEPTEAFYNLLIKSPPTPLPSTARQPIPEPILPIGQGGVLGELTQATEKSEGERLEEATGKVLFELESWRSKLIANESEISTLRRELDNTQS